MKQQKDWEDMPVREKMAPRKAKEDDVKAAWKPLPKKRYSKHNTKANHYMDIV